MLLILQYKLAKRDAGVAAAGGLAARLIAEQALLPACGSHSACPDVDRPHFFIVSVR
jgi:hypothetical protein